MGEAEELMGQMQMQSQQLQNMMAQKQALMVQIHEVEKALEHLENVNDEKIYKSIGPIIIESDKEKVKKELEESKEDADLKIKSLEDHEKKLKNKLQEAQENIQKMIGKDNGRAA
jgi:prefoldin beta subunit